LPLQLQLFSSGKTYVVLLSLFHSICVRCSKQPAAAASPFDAFVNLALALRAVQLLFFFFVFVSAWSKLGKEGVFYGVRFGRVIPWVHSEVFDRVQHPQYVGAVLSYLGVWLLAPTAATFHVVCIRIDPLRSFHSISTAACFTLSSGIDGLILLCFHRLNRTHPHDDEYRSKKSEIQLIRTALIVSSNHLQSKASRFSTIPVPLFVQAAAQ
jgi:hypothetical protein